MDGVDLEDVVSGGFPTCEFDGAWLEPRGTDERPFWACPRCGAIAVSR